MSYHRFSIVQGRAVVDKRVTNAQFRTLSALGMYADKDGWCFPSQSTVGDDLGKSRQTVNEDIAALVEHGYVEKVTTPTGRGKEVHVRYRLLFDSTPTEGVEVPGQGMSNLPDSNDPSNDPINDNTASGEKPALLPIESLGLDWQIKASSKIVTLPDIQNQQMMDAANLIAMQGFGINYHIAYGIAYTFMKTRGIIIPNSKIKGQRKAVKDMIEMGVLPNHVQEATQKLMDSKKKLTITDLYAVAKTAIDIANPAPDTYDGMIEGV